MRHMESSQTKIKLRVDICAALFGTIAFLIMAAISIPIIPSASYLKYEPSGAILLMAAVLLNPIAGLAACFIKDVLYFFIMGANPIGLVGDFLCTGLFSLTGSLLLRRQSNWKWQVISLISAALTSTIVMIPSNFLILYLEFGTPPEGVWASMPVIVCFNLGKGVLNGCMFFMLTGVVRRIEMGGAQRQ